jgi:hypothetical protein
VRCVYQNITCLKIGICVAWCLDARQWVFSHQPSLESLAGLGAGGDPRPLLLSDRPKPLDGKILPSRGTGIQQIPNTGGNFLLSKYLFPRFSSFLSVDYAFASRIGAPLNLVVCQLRPQTGTYFKERLWCVVLFINFKTSNVLSKFQRTFWYFENRGTVLNLVPQLCVRVIYKFTMVILNENRWSTSRTPHLVGIWLVEIFMHLGLNQVHGLILGLVFQVGGFGLSGTRVMSSKWIRVTDQILEPLPHDVIPLYDT